MATVDSVTTATVPFDVPQAGKSCHTFYKIFGDLKSGTPPLIVLHGGPGSGHEYCLPFGRLWSLYNIPTVLYDQIGCAKSTHLREKAGDRSFWKFELFVAELENLLDQLGINGGAYDVLGHSFGGIIATIFAARRPAGLRRLILVGAPASGPLFFKGLWQITKQLSAKSQYGIQEAVRTKNFGDQSYLDAVEEFSRMFLCRGDPWPPEELALDIKNHTEDPTVRHTFAGLSPWIYDGPLGEWDSVPYLPLINVPTFVLNGEFDTTQYEPTAPFFNHIQRVRWVTVANASHMGHLDSAPLQEKFLKLIGEFLNFKELEEQSNVE